MNIEDVIGDKRSTVLAIAARHGAKNVRIFGSLARGEADDASDVDVLVDMEPGRSLMDMGAMLMELQELLHRHVDVVTTAGLRERIRERVIREAVPV
jgi:predicted nucleotidyltransferase